LFYKWWKIQMFKHLAWIDLKQNTFHNMVFHWIDKFYYLCQILHLTNWIIYNVMSNLYCESIIQYCMTNPSLGGTIKDTTPPFYMAHWTLKNRKRLNKYFHYIFLVNKFIRLYKIWNFNMSRLFCVLMFLIIPFFLKLKKYHGVSFFWTFWLRTHCVWNMSFEIFLGK
jgi:hypothetical protein